MLCPHCASTMREMTKTGVLIDVCPECKGVWLDRGELDKILSRARAVGREWDEDTERLERRWRRDEEDAEESASSDSKRYGRKRRWSDIFDIFD